MGSFFNGYGRLLLKDTQIRLTFWLDIHLGNLNTGFNIEKDANLEHIYSHNRVILLWVFRVPVVLNTPSVRYNF
jgi:hypothetical protein